MGTEYYNDSSGQRKMRKFQKLGIDRDGMKKAAEDDAEREGGGTTKKGRGQEPENSEAYEILNAEDRPRPEGGWYKEFCKALVESHHISLHVLDVQRCQVMSLMDKTAIDEYHTINSKSWGVDFDGEGHVTATYGHHLPSLHGVPPK